MSAPQLLGRPIQQGPVRQEIASGQQDLDQRPVALTAGVPTRPDRTKLAFIGNPDLPARLRLDAPLAAFDGGTLYTPGPVGYSDYPSLAETAAA